MIKRLLDNLNEMQIRCLMAVSMILLSMAMIAVDAISYDHYRKNLIATEQGQLLTIAQITAAGLDRYLEQELRTIDLCFDTADDGQDALNLDDLDSKIRQLLNSTEGLYRSCVKLTGQANDDTYNDELIDTNQDIVGQVAPAEAYRRQEQGKATIVSKHLADTGWYEMVISRVVDTVSGPVTLLFSMDLNYVYKKIVAPVHIGNGGYSVVKDHDLAIIMHHAKSQIGMDALYDREEQYPDLDLSSLKEWLELQRRQSEGVGILDSYVWDDPELAPVRRIVAYTTIDIQDEHWIINSTLPIEEISEPLRFMLLTMAVLTAIFLLTITLITTAVTRTLTLSVAQKKEIEYLKEINSRNELIAAKNDEIRHYQRIQSLGMMSSHIAHEFNNYLTPVMVYGEMLQDDVDISEDNRVMLGEMMKSVEQAAKLSRDLLDFSRMDAGGRNVPLNLTAEVEEAVAVLRQLVPKKIHFSAAISDLPAWLMGREGMMQHSFMNLGKNAFHAMDETDQKVLSVNYSVDGDLAVLSISDTGCGIPAEKLKDIFEPFYTTKGSSQGTGLGLSVVRSLTENAGGTITVKSTPDKGTTFILSFPIKKDEAMLHTHRNLSSAKNAICACRSRESVSPWRGWLDSLEAHIEFTTKEAAVVVRMQENTAAYDLMILEEELLSMSGIELAQIVRRSNPELPIVILAKQESPELKRCQDNRIIDRIQLP